MNDEFEELDEKFIQRFKVLTNARPDLEGDAYPTFAQNLLQQYKDAYELLKLECDIEMARKKIKLKSLRANLIPERQERRFLWFRLKPRQNYAQTLMDVEVAKQTEEFFAKLEAELLAPPPSAAPDQTTDNAGQADDPSTPSNKGWKIINYPKPDEQPISEDPEQKPEKQPQIPAAENLPPVQEESKQKMKPKKQKKEKNGGS